MVMKSATGQGQQASGGRQGTDFEQAGQRGLLSADDSAASSQSQAGAAAAAQALNPGASMQGLRRPCQPETVPLSSPDTLGAPVWPGKLCSTV